MHIPDGFLNNGTAGSLLAVALGAVGYAFNKVRQAFFVREKVAVLKTPEGAEFGGTVAVKLTQYGKSKIVKMLAVGVFIFAAQLFDIFTIRGLPVHFLGGALAAILLGPLEGIIVVSAVLAIQCLALGDGGLMALGANIFNMGIVGVAGSYCIYKLLLKRIKSNLIAVFLAAWLGVIVSALFYGLELISSHSLANVLLVYTLAGLIEGFLTILILRVLGWRGVV